MENISKKTGLVLTPHLFKTLHARLLNELFKEYNITLNTLLDYQLYGFNNYDESLPSIKGLIYERTGINVNGKYLYNKKREFEKGIAPIKFNREFVFIYFKTLGFTDLNDFVLKSDIDDEKKKEQIQLQEPSFKNEEEYFVGYYLGEENTIIKTKLIISEEKSTVTWIMGYWELEKKISLYKYKGYITHKENSMSFYFKQSDSDLNRSLFMSVFCNQRLKFKQFLRGGYCGYDKKGNPVVGEIVFVRVQNKEHLEKEALSNKINPIIAQYINKKRIIIPGNTPYNLIDLSKGSNYAHIIEDYINTYSGWFVTLENGIYTVEIKIVNNLGKSIIKIAGHSLYKGNFKVSSTGNSLSGEFKNTDSLDSIYVNIDGFSSAKKEELVGTMMGNSSADTSFCGKLYLLLDSTNTKKELKFNATTLTAENAKNLPHFMLTDIEKLINKNPYQFIFTNSSKNKVDINIGYFTGNYSVTSSEMGKTFIATLRINEDGTTTLKQDFFYYEGNCMLSEGALLCITFNKRNGIPHCGQIINKVVANTNTKFSPNGSWHYLDDNLKPNIRTIVIV